MIKIGIENNLISIFWKLAEMRQRPPTCFTLYFVVFVAAWFTSIRSFRPAAPLVFLTYLLKKYLKDGFKDMDDYYHHMTNRQQQSGSTDATDRRTELFVA